jgi:hypothetical protein
MNKLALVSLSLVSLVGIATAQTPPAKGAPAVPAAEKKAPPPAADAKKPAPPAPTTDKPATPPKPAEAPPELADFAKKMGGTWKCTGQAEVMGQMIDVNATITHKVDATLNKFWIQTSFSGSAAKMPKAPPMKSLWYTSYDPNAKKLWRVTMNARGGHGWELGTVSDTKLSWEGEQHWADGTDAKVRGTEEWVSPKEVKAVGEYSKDGGKTWTKDHDATCKK